MGAKSTCDITKEDAVCEIVKHLLKASDRQLEEVLEDLVGDDYLLNFSIVIEYLDEDEGGWPITYESRGPF